MIQPKTHALAYRIWAYAEPREWNCTVNELANALNENRKSIVAACTAKGWNHRLRTAVTYDANYVSSSAYPSEVNSLLREQVRASSVNQSVTEAGE